MSAPTRCHLEIFQYNDHTRPAAGVTFDNLELRTAFSWRCTSTFGNGGTMRTSLRLTIAAFGLASFNICAATPARLFVAVSQESTYSSERTSAIMAFDLDSVGFPVQRESYFSQGIGDSNHSEQEIRVDSVGKYLFLPNNLSSNLSVYAVTPDGRLAELSESPLAAGPEPAFTAVHPNGRYLYLGCWGSLGEQIRVYDLSDTNHVHEIQAIDFSGAPRGMVMTPDGRFLYVADMTAGGPGVRAFRIAEAGFLTESPTSSQGVTFQRPSSLAITPDGEHLLLLDLDVGGFMYTVNPIGELLLADSTAYGQPPFPQLHLEIAMAGEDLRLSWLGGNTNVALFGSTALEGPYELLTASQTQEGELLVVNMAPTSDRGFFRLQLQSKGILPPVFSANVVFAMDGRFAYWHQPYGGGLVGAELRTDGTLTLVPGVPFGASSIVAALLNPERTSILYEVSRTAVGIRLLDIQSDGSLVQRGEPVMIQAPPGYEGCTPNGACVLYR